MAFDSPNYTQIPNELLDRYLRVMSPAELKVTLAILRRTLGFHQGSAAVSISDLELLTGMSRPTVICACRDARARGLLERCSKPGERSIWVVKFLNQGGKGFLPEPGKEPLPQEKERKKPSERKRSGPARVGRLAPVARYAGRPGT